MDRGHGLSEDPSRCQWNGMITAGAAGHGLAFKPEISRLPGQCHDRSHRRDMMVPSEPASRSLSATSGRPIWRNTRRSARFVRARLDLPSAHGFIFRSAASRGWKPSPRVAMTLLPDVRVYDAARSDSGACGEQSASGANARRRQGHHRGPNFILKRRGIKLNRSAGQLHLDGTTAIRQPGQGRAADALRALTPAPLGGPDRRRLPHVTAGPGAVARQRARGRSGALIPPAGSSNGPTPRTDPVGANRIRRWCARRTAPYRTPRVLTRQDDVRPGEDHRADADRHRRMQRTRRLIWRRRSSLLVNSPASGRSCTGRGHTPHDAGEEPRGALFRAVQAFLDRRCCRPEALLFGTPLPALPLHRRKHEDHQQHRRHRQQQRADRPLDEHRRVAT